MDMQGLQYLLRVIGTDFMMMTRVGDISWSKVKFTSTVVLGEGHLQRTVSSSLGI